jgi:hypothetical protein
VATSVFATKICTNLSSDHCLISFEFNTHMIFEPVPVAARSKAWVCGCSLAGIVGSNSVGGMDVCFLSVFCVLSGRCLCVGLTSRPEDSYGLWCVVVCDREASIMGEALAHWGLLRERKRNIYLLKS